MFVTNKADHSFNSLIAIVQFYKIINLKIRKFLAYILFIKQQVKNEQITKEFYDYICFIFYIIIKKFRNIKELIICHKFL